MVDEVADVSRDEHMEGRYVNIRKVDFILNVIGRIITLGRRVA